jgi:inorganic phosphate transporter, PiT family
MVKFGEKLSALKVPRFSKSYVSYDLLKSYIDQIVDFEKTGDLVNANSRTETFVMVLSEDLNVIEHTYSKTLKELSDSLKTSVEEDVDTLVAATAFAGELEGQLNAGSKDEAALKSFVEFSKKLEDLNRYCLVNNEGVRKIIKKYEKCVTVRSLADFFKNEQKNKTFCTYTDVGSLNVALKDRERTLSTAIRNRSSILDHYIKSTKGLSGLLDKYSAGDPGESLKPHLRCCEYSIRFTCFEVAVDKDSDKTLNGSSKQDACAYYTQRCFWKWLPCGSYLHRWLFVTASISLIAAGVVLIFVYGIKPARMETMTIIGVLLSFLLGIANGANDIANSVGTSVGAKALTLKQAIFWGIIFEFFGAIFMGTEVAKQIAKGIIDPGAYQTNPSTGDCDGPRTFSVGMLAVLFGAGSTTLLATVYGLPISATHGIIGGLVAVGLMSRGVESLGIAPLLSTMAAWVLSPLVGAIASGLMHAVIQLVVYGDNISTESVPARSEALQPVFLGFGVAISTAFLLTKGPSLIKVKPLGVAILVAVGVAVLFGCVLALYRKFKKNGKDHDDPASENGNDGLSSDKLNVEMAPKIESPLSTPREQEGGNAVNLIRIGDTDPEAKTRFRDAQNREAAEKHFVPLLILSALTVAFAHGGNDVGNAIGPLAVIIEVKDFGKLNGTPSIDILLLLLGAFSFATGIALLGTRTIITVGTKITALTPSKSFATQLGAAVAVLLSTSLGLPVSTSHCLVGSIVGVGISSKLVELRRKYACGDSTVSVVETNAQLDFAMLLKILNGWLVTIPAAMLTAMVAYAVLIGFFVDGNLPRGSIISTTTLIRISNTSSVNSTVLSCPY